MRIGSALLSLLVVAPLTAQRPALIPEPVSATFADAGFVLPDTVSIALAPASPRMREIAGVLQAALAERGVTSRVVDGAVVDKGILLRISNPAAGDESYELVSTPHAVLVEGRAEAGVLWGVQTLRQLVDSTAGGLQVHGAEITDRPRYAWRGSMLDVGRHLFPVGYILSHLDWMSRHKMNVFHWHLTEDQGWRLQVDALPRLTEVGAWREDPAAPASPEGGVATAGGRYGGFYTKAEVRLVVERARVLGITVVPEIEMPGHSRAALAAYPDLGCSGDTLSVPNSWGVFTDVLCPGKEATFRFLETVLAEVLELFPSRYIHIGGDEVPKQRWQACEACQTIIRREKLGDEHGLQRWMIARIGRWLGEHGRKLIGWDEIIEGGVPEGATVQAWRGGAKIAEAIAAGADVIASPSEWVYLNSPANSLPLSRVAMFDPAAPAPPEGGAGPISQPARTAGRLLGVEAPLWTEHVTSPANAELMWWPRLLVVAEIGWRGRADTATLGSRVARIARAMRDEGVAVGPDDEALVSLRFRYDSASGGVRVARDQGIDGLRLVLASPGEAPREVHDGDRLPTAGTWTLSARWQGEPVGEARVITAVEHLGVGKPVRLATPTDTRYPGTGAGTLVDGVRGTAFNDGFWNGWQGPDLDAAINLLHAQPVHRVTLSLLEAVNSWILYPPSVDLLVSDDGEQWRLVEHRVLNLPVVAGATSRREVRFDLPAGTRTRWVRLVAKGGQRLPAWHLGAGGEAWIFSDEIEVR